MSNAFKIIIIAVTAIIVCIVSVVSINLTKEGKAMVNAGSTQVKNISENYSNIEYSSYDNTNLLGSALADLIEDTITNKEYLSIWVKTLSNKTTGVYYNYTLTTAASGNTIATGTALTTITTDSTNINYINGGAQFTGKVYKDVNKNTIAIEFVQLN